MLCSGIIELPTFVSIWIPNEYTFLIVRLKCIALVLLDMYIGS